MDCSVKYKSKVSNQIKVKALLYFFFSFYFQSFPPSYLFLVTNKSKDYSTTPPPLFLNTIFGL